MRRPLLLAVPAALALFASQASAQIRPVPVITGRPPIVTLQPQINPLYASPYSATPVLNTYPTYSRPVVLPATWTQPAVIPTQITPWGVQPPQFFPGVYTPPQVATVEPSRYFPVAPFTAINPVNGNIYDGWNNTFTNRDGTYLYNPWTDSFVNPLNNATYNPYSGVTIRPLNPVAAYNNFYNRNPYPLFIR